MRRFWQWLCGYVCVCLNGRQLNRFMNLCSRNGIHLWHIYYDLEHRIRVNLFLRDFYHLKPFLKKTKTRLRIMKRHGFPFWCHRHPRLKWFFVVCICFICILSYSFTFIWNINIHGNTKISTQEILNCLEAQQITVGQKSNSIDCSQVEYYIRSEFQNIGWVSVYVDHTNLNIEIKESLYDEYEISNTSEEQYDLIANKDAVIWSIVTRTGKAAVKEGQRVKTGDVLVIGQCAIYDDVGEVKEVLKRKADALVIADVTYDFSYELSEIEIIALKIAGTYTDETLNFIANKKMHQFIEKLEQNGVIILNKNVKIEKKEKSIIFSGTIDAREKIGTNILVEEILENEFE